MSASPGELSATERATAAGPCVTCVAVSLALIVAVVASFVGLGIDYSGLFSAESQHQAQRQIGRASCRERV